MDLRLQLFRVPYFLGGHFDAVFKNPRLIGRVEELTYTLRFVEVDTLVQQTADPIRTGRYSSREVVRYQHWADSMTAEPGLLDWAAIGGIPVSVPLPQGKKRTTRVVGRNRRYWELVVTSGNSVLAKRAVFLVPIFARGKG